MYWILQQIQMILLIGVITNDSINDSNDIGNDNYD